MPIVVVEWVGGRDDKKVDVARGIVDVLERVAGVPPNSTNVLFRDYGAEDWFIGTDSIASIRASRATP